jgi:hypothetical protein
MFFREAQACDALACHWFVAAWTAAWLFFERVPQPAKQTIENFLEGFGWQ